MDPSEIGRATRLLEKERREKMKELMDEWDRTYYYPKLKELRDQCTHNFRFIDTNPIGYPIFTCSICGRTEIRKED